MQVDQTLQEQENAVGLPWSSEKGQEVSNILLDPFPGLCSIPTSQEVQTGCGNKGLCCPPGLGWGHSHLRASDQCSSTDSEPFDASQDTGNWGLEPLKSQLPPKEFPRDMCWRLSVSPKATKVPSGAVASCGKRHQPP